MSDHELSVLVQVDLVGKDVRLGVTGSLTELSQYALHPIIRRARSLVPGVRVVVDLGRAHRVEATALNLMRRAVEHDDPRRPAGQVQFIGTVRSARLPGTGVDVPLPARPGPAEEVAA